MNAPRGKTALLLVLGLFALGTALFWPRLFFDPAAVDVSTSPAAPAIPALPAPASTPPPVAPPPVAAAETAAGDLLAPRPVPAPPAAKLTLPASPLEPAPKDSSEPNSDFFDPVYGVTGKIPEGWTMRNSARWGTLETTLFFRDPDAPMAAPSFYYRVFAEPMKHNSPAEIEAWLRETAEGKARQRVAGLPDYTNGEVVMHSINDRPALTWTATYTRNGEPWGEFLTRLYSPNGTYLFFLHAPAADLPAVRAKFETMIKTTVVP